MTTPTLFIIGTGSPMPETACTATAAFWDEPPPSTAVPGGHFPWLAHPGATRAAVDRFLAALP